MNGLGNACVRQNGVETISDRTGDFRDESSSGFGRKSQLRRRRKLFGSKRAGEQVAAFRTRLSSYDVFFAVFGLHRCSGFGWKIECDCESRFTLLGSVEKCFQIRGGFEIAIIGLA